MNDVININQHMKAFAESFVLNERKDRWVGFLTNRPKKVFKRSSELYNHLNEKYFSQNDTLVNVAPDDVMGIFYNFYDEPKRITFAEAKDEGHNQDAIFSIKPGKLAVYFFHEGWNFVCKR